MKKLLLLSCLLTTTHLFANDSVSVEEMKIESMQRDITIQKEKLEDKEREIEALMQQHEDSIDSRLAIYTGIFLGVLAIASWLLNWLGKREVRNIAEEIANKKTDAELKAKLSIEIIDNKIKEVSTPLIDAAIKDFKQKANEAHVIITQETEFVKKDRENYELERVKMFSAKEGEPLTQEQKDATDIVQQKSAKEIKAGDSTKAVIDFLYAKGVKAFSEKEYTVALSYFNDILELDENNNDVLFYRSSCHFHLDRLENAFNDINQFIKSNPQSEAAHNNLALLLEDHFHDHNNAKLHYEKAIEINPKYFEAHYNFALLLKNQFQDYDNAKLHYEEAIEINPTDTDAYTNLTYLLKDHFNDPAKAKDLYLKAIQINPLQKKPVRDKDFGVE